MKKTLSDVYADKLEAANKTDLTQFIFIHDGIHYYVAWRNGIWSDPSKIVTI